MRVRATWIACVLLLTVGLVRAAGPTTVPADPPVMQGDFDVADFHFASGQTLPRLRIHYRTLGRPHRDAAGHVDNAVLILHGTTGDGAQFLRPSFSGVLFGPGQLLDAGRFYLILPDDIGHGQSSRPSQGLHARFPNYRYADMVEAEHRLVVNGLHVDHLRLVMGTSMGGMHTWMWGERWPDQMDALMPLASLPVAISGRNRMWRRMIADDIRDDPAWMNGDYRQQPPGLRLAAEMLYFMGSNPARRAEAYPTGNAAVSALETYADRAQQYLDANDVLYALDSSLDYDPAPDLSTIRAPLLAVNTADDLINPPDLDVLERQVTRIAHGRSVVLPEGPDTDGHGTHTLAKVWSGELKALLDASAQR